MAEKATKRAERFDKRENIDEYLGDTIKSPGEEPETIPDPDLTEEFEVATADEEVEDDSYKDYM